LTVNVADFEELTLSRPEGNVGHWTRSNGSFRNHPSLSEHFSFKSRPCVLERLEVGKIAQRVEPESIDFRKQRKDMLIADPHVADVISFGVPNRRWGRGQVPVQQRRLKARQKAASGRARSLF